ncbi:hypothetical protein [Micromonospora sp. NPDC049301]|uniref:hypothetical protein n=1 Tax=Micromonospora sp. NPDC049301 TaxID=3155723 RepID=UPI003423C1B9
MDEQHLDGFTVEGTNSSLDGPEPFSVLYRGTTGQPEMIALPPNLEQAGCQVEADRSARACS